MVSYGALKAVCKAGDDVERQRSALKRLFGSFVKCDKNVVRTQVSQKRGRREGKGGCAATHTYIKYLSNRGLSVSSKCPSSITIALLP